MVNDDKIKLLSQLVHRHVTKFMQGPLLPTNAYPGMKFFVALGCGHQRRQGAAVIPGDSGQLKKFCHGSGMDLHRHVGPRGFASGLDNLHGGIAKPAVGAVGF